MSRDLKPKKNKESQSNASISRKKFIEKSTLSLLSLSSLATLGFDTSKSDFKFTTKFNNTTTLLRTISYNIFNGGIGYKGVNSHKLPKGKESMLIKRAREMEQIPRRIALQLALYIPNIISFSESAQKDTISKMAKWLEMDYVFFPSSNYKGSFPGSVLTHYEIVNSENRPFVDNNDSQELFTRHWGKAEIRLPNGNKITVHSAHLWPFKKTNEDTDIRLAEIEALLKSIHRDSSNGAKSVILQGDLNQTPGTPEYQKLREAGLIDTFAKVGKGEGFTIKADKPDRRLDYIFAFGPIEKKICRSRPLYEGDFRINNDDPRSFALSDHIPQLAEFEIN